MRPRWLQMALNIPVVTSLNRGLLAVSAPGQLTYRFACGRCYYLREVVEYPGDSFRA